MLDPKERRQLLRGILLLVTASAVFAAVDGFSKMLAETQSVGQIVWARYALSLPVLLAATPPSAMGGPVPHPPSAACRSRAA